MIVTELAEVNVPYVAGQLLGISVFPIVGLILLIVGLRRRPRTRQPNYPPPPPSPYGPPPNAGLSYQPTPPSPPIPPPYPAPQKDRSSTVMIVVGLLLLAFGLFGIAGRAADVAPHREAAPSVKVGQCIEQSSFQANDMRPKPHDCAEPDALLEVAVAGGGSATCPDGKLKDSQYAVLFDKTVTLCFLLNLKQGQCYSMSGEPDNPTFATSACDAAVPLINVVKRIDGETDRTLCPAETKPITYLKPARLYCLQPLKN